MASKLSVKYFQYIIGKLWLLSKNNKNKIRVLRQATISNIYIFLYRTIHDLLKVNKYIKCKSMDDMKRIKGLNI